MCVCLGEAGLVTVVVVVWVWVRVGVDGWWWDLHQVVRTTLYA